MTFIPHKPAVPAGRYARSLRLILRRARRQKYIPPPSVPGSPNKAHMSFGNPGLRPLTSMSNSQATNANIGGTALMQSTLMSNSGMAPSGGQQPSPGNSLPGSLGGKNESPSSNPESYEYDWNFAQDLLNRAGMPLEENSQLPLYVFSCQREELSLTRLPMHSFLNGESLGNSGEGHHNPLVGLETFFLPPGKSPRRRDRKLLAHKTLKRRHRLANQHARQWGQL